MKRQSGIRRRVILIGVARVVLLVAVLLPIAAAFTDLSGAELAITAGVLVFIIAAVEAAATVGINRSLNASMRPLIDFSRAISGGDLTGSLDRRSEDVIGDLVDAQNAMVDGLRRILDKLREASFHVSTTAEELAAASDQVMASAQEVSSTVEQISRGSESQARSVEETSEIINEIARMGVSVADQARASAETARAANEVARSGSEYAEQAAMRMRELQSSIESVTGTMHGLGERSAQIGLVVDVITGIADQTNMLALNAAIEASRAGEHGRGFAVVADEVRGLAEGSRKAADQIARMIGDTETETRRALRAMDESSAIVGGSMEVIQSALDALGHVAGIVEEIAGSSDSVYRATEAQREGYDRVVKDTHDIAAIAEEAAAGTQQASAAANEQTASMEEMRASIQELARLSVEMRILVDEFRLSGGG